MADVHLLSYEKINRQVKENSSNLKKNNRVMFECFHFLEPKFLQGGFFKIKFQTLITRFRRETPLQESLLTFSFAKHVF